jgi:DNA-binding beta-propeller fold protein YncE
MSRGVLTIAAALASLMLAGETTPAQAPDQAPLQLEAKILLGNVRGRIDHMAIDLKRQRLFVAELGNDSVGVVDLANGSVMRRISGLNEPQGVGYEPSTDTLLVANARDGSVKFFDGDNYAAKGQIELGSDADNIRIDTTSKRVIVGYGDGGLAVLEPESRIKVQNAPLKAHPESFQLEPNTGRVFVNLPGARAVAVVDGKSGKELASWPMSKGGNYAMAIDRDRNQLLVAFRKPPELGIFALEDGKAVATAEACGDIDDLFVDAKRKRIYVSCGQGYVDVLQVSGAAYQRTARIPTATGARTSLFIPDLDRFIVAVRESLAGPAAVWIFRPKP